MQILQLYRSVALHIDSARTDSAQRGACVLKFLFDVNFLLLKVQSLSDQIHVRLNMSMR